MSIDIRELQWTSAEATALRGEMDAELRPRYEDLFDPGHRPAPVDLEQVLVTLVAFDGDVPVGTTSLKRTQGYAEVKRVFVAATHRRGGVAALLLTAIEEWARARGFSELVLQTGARQPEAIALYEREGWFAIAPFGPYENDAVISRCFAKPITPLVIAVELPSVGAASDLVARASAAARALDAAGADLVIVSDELLATDDGRARIDAPTLAAFLAPATGSIAFAPVVETTHTEPFHVAKVIQTLDHVSRGRAAWQVSVSTDEDEAALFGRREAPSVADAWEEAEEAIEVAERLWDSWEDDAEIRDVATGRFIDRDKVHHIDFEGRFFSVRGPSIVPRSPQGRPPVIVRVDGDESLDVAARRADVIRVSSVDDVARVRERTAGRPVTVLLDVAIDSGADDEAAALGARLATLRHDTGADGVVLVYRELPGDATSVASAVTPFTRADAGTLRDRLGLDRPASAYAGPIEPSDRPLTEGSVRA